MRTVAVVQARMSSQRLPGKVLADLAGRPALSLLVDRLSRAESLDQIVVATSTDPSDDTLAQWCESNGVGVARGSLTDVLARFRIAAEKSNAAATVRITADCPLIDPDIVDGLVALFKAQQLGYCGLSGEYPHGLDCEVFSWDTLVAAEAEATTDYDREHVTPFMKRHPERFRTATYAPFVGRAHERWTLDYPEDLLLLQAVVERLDSPVGATTSAVIELLDEQPGLRRLNEMRMQIR